MGAHNLSFSIHLPKHQTLDVPFTRRHMHTSDTDTHVHMHNRTATYMNNQNQNSSKHINFLCGWKYNNKYNKTHVTSVPIWPKFELVQNFMPVLLPVSLTKIRLKMKALAWRHRFNRYKSMGAFCFWQPQFWWNMQHFPHPTDDTYKIWSRLANWSWRFYNKSTENLIRPQGRVTPKWQIRSDQNSNSSVVLCNIV